MKTHQVSLLVGGIVTLLALAPAAGAVSSSDFAVQINGGPAPAGPLPGSAPDCATPDLSAGPPTSINCDWSYSWLDATKTLDGSVTRLAGGGVGKITVICNWGMDLVVKVGVPIIGGAAGAPQMQTFSGTGSQTCSWAMDFGGDSTLVGTLSGPSELGLVDPATGFFRGTLTATVVGGAGEFAGASGGGTFVEREEFAFDLQSRLPATVPSGSIPAGAISGGGIPPGAIPGLSREFAVAAQEGSSMALKVTKGKVRARIVLPGPKLPRSSSYALQVASAPGARCIARAQKGAQRVALGRGRDADRNGTILVGGPLGKKLGSGK